MKKILFVQYSAKPDGSTQSGLLLVNGFKENGWESHITFAQEGLMVKEYERNGHSSQVIPHNSWLRRNKLFYFLKDFLVELRKSLDFKKVIKTYNPDLVYINTSVSISAAFAAKSLKKPVVWHLRELPFFVGGEMIFPGFLTKTIQFIFRKLSSQIIANSKNVAINLLGDSELKNSIVIYNSIDEKCFQNSNSLNENKLKATIEGDFDYLIGIPGMLRPMKGHLFLLETIANYFKKDKSIKWIITGDGAPDYVKQLKTFVKLNGLNERVQFLGSITDMNSFYRICDLIVIPSKSEPFGRTVIEAMANEKPIIATKVGGIPEIIDDEKNGILVEFGDTTQLRNAILRIKSDHQFSNSIKRDGYKTAAQKYTTEKYVNSIIKVIQNVMN